MTAAKRLWEIDHPYYGPESNYYSANDPVIRYESLDELLAVANDYDADMNHIYRWDWQPWENEHESDVLQLFVVLPRKGLFTVWQAPVERTDECEAKVLAFLRSDRVVGALRLMWEPVL